MCSSVGRGDTGGDIGDVDVERIWNLKNSRKSTPGIQTAFVTVIMPVFQTKVPLWTRSWGRLGLLPSSSLAWLDGVYLLRDAHAGEAGLGVIPAVPRLVWSRLTPPDPVTFSPAVMPQSGYISLSRKHVTSASLLPLIHVAGWSARLCRLQQTRAHTTGMQRAARLLASDCRLFTWGGMWSQPV